MTDSEESAGKREADAKAHDRCAPDIIDRMAQAEDDMSRGAWGAVWAGFPADRRAAVSQSLARHALHLGAQLADERNVSIALGLPRRAAALDVSVTACAYLATWLADQAREADAEEPAKPATPEPDDAR